MYKRQDAEKARILIVDDEEAILSAMSEFFTIAGFDVDCAQELEEAEALLCHREYALIIADLRLSGTNGAEGLEILRFVDERCPKTRSILLTAYGSPEVEIQARQRGSSVFLRKPTPLPELLRVATELLRRPQ